MLKEVGPAHTGEFGLRHEEASCKGQAGTSHTEDQKKAFRDSRERRCKGFSPKEKLQPQSLQRQNLQSLQRLRPQSLTKNALAPPSKAAWNDVKYQTQTLKKKGKTHLRKAWQEAQSQGQMAKREFYYNIFLLDPDVAHKQVHKESLQRHTEESTVEKGWMTKWKIGKLQGADPSLPNFESV